MTSDKSILTTPTIEDFRKEFPKPEGISDPVNEIHGFDKNSMEHTNVDHGWIAPNGTFFRCTYAEHDSWAERLLAYWDEIIVETFPSYLNIRTYEEDSCYKPSTSFRFYDGHSNEADYLVSLGWLKWMYRQSHHEILKGNRDISKRQWNRISWLNIYSSTSIYKIVDVNI